MTPARSRAILIGLLFLFVIEMLRMAWASDDSLITLRCVLNALHGYGPQYNIDERVQPFTHPLWFLALLASTWVVHSPWAAALILSAGCGMASLWLIYGRMGGGSWHALLLASLVLVCKPYADFAASGLENPLANLLILAVIDAGWRRMAGGGRAIWPLFLFGLLTLTRMDLALLLAPFILLVLARTFRGGRTLAAECGMAAVPVLAWSAFSLCYYGFVVPNTAFAKLGTHIANAEMVRQGVIYLLDGLGHDLVALPCMAAAVAVGLRGGWPGRSLAAGIILYLIYVVEIGGDFMSGRFLVAPFVAAIACLVLLPPAVPEIQAACLGVLGLLNLATVFPTAMAPSLPPGIAITDERAWWSALGLVRIDRFELATPHWAKHVARIERVSLLECGGLGLLGLTSGPTVHLADRCALADPLLSHLPMAPDPSWRIGHFTRTLPEGYEASLRDDRNEVRDPAIHALYDDVRLVTRGKLFSLARWGAIWRLNTGRQRLPQP